MMKRLLLYALIACIGVFFLAPHGLAKTAGNEAETSCVKPAKGPIVKNEGSQRAGSPPAAASVDPVRVMVGKPAVDFEATAYHKGKFKNIKLSDYKGKWVVLCFYPGDFTFV